MLWCAVICAISSMNGQGPPLTADKPIMLGSKSVIIKTLSEFRNTEEGSYARIPLMIHYLPTSNSLVAIHVPWTHFDSDSDSENNGSYLGDIDILAKYQFYRADGKGRTFRMVVKSLQRLPTGKNYGPQEISTDNYQHYLGVVGGLETIKYGVSGEVGYNMVPSGLQDEWRARLGFGLPLLKQVYPPKQFNLYFEYAYNERPQLNERELLYAQGIQYAKGRLTLEAGIQIPIYQKVNRYALKSNLLFGTRYVF